MPTVESYLPSGNGESPLANVTDWLEIWFNFDTGASVPASQPCPAGDEWVRAREEQLREDEPGNGAVQKEVVPLDRGSDRARDDRAPELLPVNRGRDAAGLSVRIHGAESILDGVLE